LIARWCCSAHGPDGAFGWIINGRELMTLPELLVRAEITEKLIQAPGHVRVGGPVSPEQVWLVYKTEERLPDIEGQFEVGQGITASASRKVLEAACYAPRACSASSATRAGANAARTKFASVPGRPRT
jgi:putative AlgH/UPF0301 family transcriptional regulator